jgi:hypothetical protein
MPRKTFNSETARQLASKHKLKLIDIQSHRADNKVTIDDVKSTLRLRLTPIPVASSSVAPVPVPVQSPVNNITLLIEPVLITGDQELALNQKNLKLLKKWWDQRIPWGADPVINHKVSLVSERRGRVLLQLSFTVTEPSPMETEISIDNAIDPDDDGNYPISIINRQIVSIDRNNNNGGEFVLVKGRIIDSKIN